MSDEQIDSRMDGDPDGTIVVSGGHGPNFDDFDSVDRAREQYVESREEKSEEVKEETVGEKVPEGDSHVEADKNLEHSPEKDPEKIEVKFLKAKVGDKELELDPDTEIPVTINGETEYRKLGDLRNHEAGQVAWDRKFSELDREFRSKEQEINLQNEELSRFRQEREELFSDISQMDELIKQGKPLEGIQFLVAQSGGNKYAFKRALMNQLMPEFERMSMMTPDELKAEMAEEENAFLREQMRSLEERKAAETSQRESQQQIAQLRETRNISQEAYEESVRDLAAAGRDNPDPRLVVEHAFMKPLVAKSESLIEQVAPEYLDNDEVVVEMAKIFAEDPNLSDEEAKDLLSDALGVKDKDQELLEKARRTGQTRGVPENPGNYKYYGSKDPSDDDFIESFSDYDELY